MVNHQLSTLPGFLWRPMKVCLGCWDPQILVRILESPESPGNFHLKSMDAKITIKQNAPTLVSSFKYMLENCQIFTTQLHGLHHLHLHLKSSAIWPQLCDHKSQCTQSDLHLFETFSYGPWGSTAAMSYESIKKTTTKTCYKEKHCKKIQYLPPPHHLFEDERLHLKNLLLLFPSAKSTRRGDSC